MKVLQISASYKPAYTYGGPTVSVSRLCEGLRKSGSVLEVLTTTANGRQELDVEVGKNTLVDGVRVTYFRRLTKDHTHFSPSLLFSLHQKLKYKDPAMLVHIHAWWNLVSIFTCLLAKLQGVPVVLSPRGTLSNYSFGNRNGGIKSLIHRFLGERLLRYCHFHVTSEKEKQDVFQLLSPKTITVIPNFVYLPHLFSTANNRSSACEFKLLFLSRIEQKKGLEVLFNGLHLFLSQNRTDYGRSVKLTVAGEGDILYTTRLKELAHRLNLSIDWIGQQNQQEKWDVMQNHDLLVLPSHDENFANVIIECLSTGTPVLISKYVGLAGYVEQEKLGWICDTTPASIAETLETTIEAEEQRRNIRARGPEQIRRDFDEDNLIKSYLTLYQKVLSNE